MIYLLNESTGVLVGVFDTIHLAEGYRSSIPGNEANTYTFLQRIDDMKYISRVTLVDGQYVYNNKSFWMDRSHLILEDYSAHYVKDLFGLDVSIDRFKIERQSNCTRLQRLTDTPSEVTLNMEVGLEFTALFREGCIKDRSKGSFTGLQIARQMDGLVLLLQSGSFKEGQEFLRDFVRNDYFTDDVLNHFSAMLASADVITYPDAV